jgi:lipid-binding SYLF domain-containing protein
MSSDLIVLVMTEPAMEKLLSARLRLGADLSLAAGSGSKAEIRSYVRADGVLAGVDLGDVTIEQDRDATVALYGREMDIRRLLAGRRSDATLQPDGN